MKSRFGSPLAVLVSLALTASEASSSEQRQPFEVLRYELMITPNFSDGAIEGDARVHVARRPGAGELTFTVNALQIESADFDGAPVPSTVAAGRLRFQLPPAAAARGVLRVRYRGRPARGLSFTGGAAHTAYFTCDWMICDQDRPGDLATLDLRLVLPRGSDSVAPGRRLRVERMSEGREAHIWREPAGRPVFMLGFAAGAMQRVRLPGRRFDVLATPGAEDARVRRLFAPTRDMAAFFAERSGVALPTGRYTQVFLADRAAQEAAGFSILGDAEVGAQEANPQEDWAIAHELAHQWWGVSLTCADWSHFWLNEGITSFMVAAWKEHRWGAAAYRREIGLARTRWQAAIAGGRDYPIAYSGEYPSLRLRRAITYNKAVVFLDTLRTQVGDQIFWRGLRAYTRNNAGRSVVTADFQHAMEAAAGRSLAPLFAEWVLESPNASG